MSRVANHGFVYRWVSALAIILVLVSVLVAAQAQGVESSYTNPVSRGAFDAFPDPAIIKGKDGYWYAYGTTDPVRQSFGDNAFHFLPTAKSKDMVNWEYAGDVFTESTFPEWLPGTPGENTFLWAPDIRYLDGKYYLYYSVAHFGATSEDSLFTIGLATAPTPTGPWTDSGGSVIEGEDCPPTTNIDPAEFTDKDGTRYMYWGSYGAICVAKLTTDGTRLASSTTQISYGHQAEAPYVVRRGDYYYLFISEGGCCSGALSSYEVFVGRSKSPLGPFVDREGVSMMASRRGGTLALSANGNKWVGPGHHSIATDFSGQQWFAYHAIDKNNPYLDPPWEHINRRPMLIDRLDWIDGWPTVRAGAWASEESQPAPVTSFSVGDDFNGDAALSSDWFREGAAQDGWQLASEQDAGTYVRQTIPSNNRSYLLSSKQAPTFFRAEADLRLPAGSTGAAGLVAAYRNPANHIEAWLDAGANALVTDVIVKGRHSTQKTTLPSGFRFDTWHNVAMELRGTSMTVEVTDARLGDPLASQQRTLPSGTGGQGAVGVVSRSARSEADNVGATPLYTPVTQTVPDPVVGLLDTNYSDEFDNEELDPAWSWVRTPAGQESSGVFTWPTQNADLYGNINNASVLLRDAPQGEYTVETKLSIDLGINTDRSFQQAGLVAYADDDNYTKLVHAAIGTGRRTEFAKEEAGAYGGMMVGPPADTTWLRISHRVDPNNGEHEYRAATSRDGEHWVWGGVWTYPAGTNTRIGLVSMGGSGATAQFDYFRVFRP